MHTAKPVTDQKAVVTHISQIRATSVFFCHLGNVLVFVWQHMTTGGSCLCLDPTKSVWPCLVWALFEIISV